MPPLFRAFCIAALLSLPCRVLAAEPPTPVFKNPYKSFYRLPSLLVTAKGTVLAGCQKRIGESGDFAPSSLVLRRSVDGGKTFEAEQTLYEKQGECAFNGNLVEDRQTGTLFACFMAFPKAESKTWFKEKWMAQGGGFSLVKSTDDGQTWSAPLAILPAPNAEGWHGGGAFNNNHGVQIQSGPHAGRLVIAARVFKAGVYEERGKGGLIYSDDHGATWRVGGVMLKDSGRINSEVTLGETPDGEIYVNSRNESGKAKAAVLPGIAPHQRLYSRSRDGGGSFYEEGAHPELFDGPCNAGQTRLPMGGDGRGDLLVFTAPALANRTHLTAYVSRDSGRTWKPGKMLWEKAGGYSDAAVLPDKTLLTVFENGPDRESAHGIVLVRCPSEGLLESPK